MRFIGNVIEKLQRHPKRVVFPEGEDENSAKSQEQGLLQRQLLEHLTDLLVFQSGIVPLHCYDWSRNEPQACRHHECGPECELSEPAA